MIKITAITLLSVLTSINLVFAQGGEEKPPTYSKWDLRTGLGSYYQGVGDMSGMQMEGEINYRFLPHFSAALSVGMGRAVGTDFFLLNSFTQGNLNVFYSPFGNHRRLDFRIGGGLSLTSVSETFIVSQVTTGTEVEQEYVIRNRNDWAYNAIVETTYTIQDRYLVGVKAFTQPANVIGQDSGVLAKIGLRF